MILQKSWFWITYTLLMMIILLSIKIQSIYIELEFLSGSESFTYISPSRNLRKSVRESVIHPMLWSNHSRPKKSPYYNIWIFFGQLDFWYKLFYHGKGENRYENHLLHPCDDLIILDHRDHTHDIRSFFLGSKIIDIYFMSGKMRKSVWKSLILFLVMNVLFFILSGSEILFFSLIFTLNTLSMLTSLSNKSSAIKSQYLKILSTSQDC